MYRADQRHGGVSTSAYSPDRSQVSVGVISCEENRCGYEEERHLLAQLYLIASAASSKARN